MLKGKMGYNKRFSTSYVQIIWKQAPEKLTSSLMSVTLENTREAHREKEKRCETVRA